MQSGTVVAFEHGDDLVEIGMVAGEVLVVLVKQEVAGGDDETRPKLLGSPPVLVLDVAGEKGPCPCPDLGGREQGHRLDRLRPYDLGRGSVFVEKDREWHLFILDEGLGVPLAAGADGDDPGSGYQNLFVSVADLTGPLAACDSAEMAKKQDQVGLVSPHIAEPARIPFGIDQCFCCQSINIERHGRTLDGN
jgi:hypothetical protein